MGYGLLLLLTPLYLSGICAFTPGLSAYAIFFFTWGAFLGIQKKDLVQVCMQYEKAVYLLSFGLGITMIITFRMPIFSTLMLGFRITSIIAVICLANRILSTTTKRIPQDFCDASYFIYLVHYVVFLALIDSAYFTLFGHSTTSLCLHFLLVPLIKVAIYISIYMCYQKAKSLITYRLQ